VANDKKIRWKRFLCKQVYEFNGVNFLFRLSGCALLPGPDVFLQAFRDGEDAARHWMERANVEPEVIGQKPFNPETYRTERLFSWSLLDLWWINAGSIKIFCLDKLIKQSSNNVLSPYPQPLAPEVRKIRA
jgi:hypothetical protein